MCVLAFKEEEEKNGKNEATVNCRVIREIRIELHEEGAAPLASLLVGRWEE